MKRIFLTVFLVSLITLMVLYGWLYISFNLSDSQNDINQAYRKKFLLYPSMRRVFRMNQIGDARMDFALDRRFTGISVTVYSDMGQELSTVTMDRVIREIMRTVSKPGGVNLNNVVSLNLSWQQIDDVQIAGLTGEYPAIYPEDGNTVPLQIFVLSRYSRYPGYTGLVADANNIFIFMDAIKDVSREQRSTENAEISTILHEFGHLLGAEHTDNPDCIMSALVESATYEYLPSRITDEYCHSDIREIEKSIGI